MAHSLTAIGVHLECAIQAEMVVELELAVIERKQSRRFRHKSIICIKATKSSKVCQGQRSCRATNRLNPEEKTLVKIFKKYTIPTPTASVLTST